MKRLDDDRFIAKLKARFPALGIAQVADIRHRRLMRWLAKSGVYAVWC